MCTLCYGEVDLSKICRIIKVEHRKDFSEKLTHKLSIFFKEVKRKKFNTFLKWKSLFHCSSVVMKQTFDHSSYIKTSICVLMKRKVSACFVEVFP